MKFRSAILSLAILAAHSAFAPIAVASGAKPRNIDPMSEPIPAPNENRIQKFTYDPDVIYRIYTTPAWHTHLKLG